MLVVMENQQAINLLGSRNAPNITRLAQTYPIATRYFSFGHPSLPNYLVLWAGSSFAVTDDGLPAAHPLEGPNLGSQLDAAGIAWAGYFEALAPGQDPTVNGGGTDGSGDPLYCAHHNPIVYFGGYDPGRVKPFASLVADLDSAEPPGFCLVVPDMANNMHDPVGSTAKDATAVKAGDTWFQSLLDGVTATAWWHQGGIVLLVWDEAYDGSGKYVDGGIGTPATTGGPVLLVILSAALADARPGASGLGGDGNWDGPLSHAGLLRSIETYFGLAPLKDAANTTYGDISPLLLALI